MTSFPAPPISAGRVRDRQRPGHADEARRWLEKAMQGTEEALKSLVESLEKSRNPDGVIPPNWNRKSTLRLLHEMRTSRAESTAIQLRQFDRRYHDPALARISRPPARTIWGCRPPATRHEPTHREAISRMCPGPPCAAGAIVSTSETGCRPRAWGRSATGHTRRRGCGPGTGSRWRARAATACRGKLRGGTLVLR